MKEMSITDHLEELRTCVMRIILIVFVSFVVCYSFSAEISEFLLTSLRVALKEQASGSIIYLGLLDKVLSQLQVAFYSSILLSSPFWFFEVWRFIKPGLHDFEIKMIRPFLLVGFFLFWTGAAFGHYLVFPMTFKVLMEWGVSDVNAAINLKDHLVLVSKVLVFLGLVFQLPNIMLILGFMGLVTKYSLRSMRRYIYVILAIVSAILTPPDVLTMMALWVPLVILFEIGVLAVALIVHPYLHRQHGVKK